MEIPEKELIPATGLDGNKYGNVDIVAACDAYRPRMKKTMDGYKAKGYSDYRELLADPLFPVWLGQSHGDRRHDGVGDQRRGTLGGCDVVCEGLERLADEARLRRWAQAVDLTPRRRVESNPEPVGM